MPRSPGSTTDERPTRQRLLDVAAARFADRGYDATSFSDLVEASGLSRGAFYFHFDSKRDLALEVFRDRQRRLQEAVMERVDPQLPALDRFCQLWIERARVIADDPSLGCLRKVASALADDPDLRDELAEVHARPVRLMAEMLAEAQRDGALRGDLDPGEIAEVAMATVVGIDEVSDRESGMADLVRRAEASLEILLRGITA